MRIEKLERKGDGGRCWRNSEKRECRAWNLARVPQMVLKILESCVTGRPAYLSVFARMSRDIRRKYAHIFQNMDTVSRKYRNRDVNDASLLPAKPIVER